MHFRLSCGRVCPQEIQCEGKCIRGIKGEPFQSENWKDLLLIMLLEHDIKPVRSREKNGHKVAVIGSGPPDLHVQEILQSLDMM